VADMADNLKTAVQVRIDEISKELFWLADEIWKNPEYNFQEHRACKAAGALLERHGFTVNTPVAGLETAFEAVWDTGKPGLHIGFFGEYDGVPGMGHACGHNLMAAMAVGAGIGMQSVMEHLTGKISVFGTPAEEGGGGKVIMLEHGAFQDLDAAMIIHSANETVVNDISYSKTDVTVNFHGKKAHAATWPEEGISALDPVLQLFQYIGGMRLRWNGRGTILGVISKGGEEAILIPEHCQAKFTIRSFDRKFKKQILKEFLAACEHIAQMTTTAFDYEMDGYTYEDIRNNPVLERLLADNLKALGETVMPRRRELGIGCTDMGNVTHEIPALQSYIQVVPALRGHTPEFAAACNTEAGNQAILKGAKAMAMTALDLLGSKERCQEMRESFLEMKQQYE